MGDKRLIEWGARYAAAAAKAAARKARALNDNKPSYAKIEERIVEIARSDTLKTELRKLDFPADKIAPKVGHQSIHNFITLDKHIFESKSHLNSILAWLALDFYPLIYFEMERLKVGEKQQFTVAVTDLLGLDPTQIVPPVDYMGVYKFFRPHTINPTQGAMLCRFTIGADDDAFTCKLEQGFVDDDGLKNTQTATGKLVPCDKRMIAMLQLRNGPVTIFIDTAHDAEMDRRIRRMSGIITIMTTNKSACAYPFYAVRVQEDFAPTDIDIDELPPRAKKVFGQGVIHHEQLA
jgi:hypothetical protein